MFESSKIPNGVRYHSAGDARVRRTIEETAMTVFAGWSYEEIIAPTLDYYSLFESGMGRVEAQRAFRFTDADGRLLALRPEVTSEIARLAATLFAERARPLRLCYAATVFRRQTQSRADWRREFTQLGGELLGANTIAADMEVLAIAVEVLERLGLTDKFVITLNDVEIFNGIVETLSLDGSKRDELRRLVDIRAVADLKSFLACKLSAQESASFANLIQLSGKNEIFDQARHVVTNPRSISALTRLARLWQIIESLNLTEHFAIDLGDVARLDYYTGLTFKIYLDGVGVAVGSGGRYDRLTARFGKPEPAVGFVLELDLLADYLAARSEWVDREVKSTVLGSGDGDVVRLFREAVKLRDANERVMIGAGE